MAAGVRFWLQQNLSDDLHNALMTAAITPGAGVSNGPVVLLVQYSAFSLHTTVGAGDKTFTQCYTYSSQSSCQPVTDITEMRLTHCCFSTPYVHTWLKVLLPHGTSATLYGHKQQQQQQQQQHQQQHQQQ
jgi:hypothetical protein